MFHAIAAHIDFSHMELRHTVVSFLKDNLESFEAFFTDDEDVAAYLEALSKHGTWGDNLVFSVCAELLQSPIHIAQAHGVQIITPDQVLNAPIWVAYDGSSHYDSVFPIGTSSQILFPQSCPSEDGSSPKQNLSSLIPDDPSQKAGISQNSKYHAWFVMSANITSFHAQQDLLLALPFDIIALQETRHTAKSQHSFSLFLKKHGFQAVWGKPQPFKFAKNKTNTCTGLNGRPGGVAIVARSHIPLQIVPPGECPIRKRLFHSCRWVHAVAAFGNCKQTLHIFLSMVSQATTVILP